MHDRCTFDYVIIRVVPRVEREEFINAGIILSCPSRKFLGADVYLDRSRFDAFAPGADLVEIEKYLNAIPVICEGGADSGPIGQLPQRSRFHWLVAPRSTIVQTSPVHTGLCIEPHSELAHLMKTMVHLESGSTSY